ncbi:MAG: MltA domain-containing protein [Betaproteobacteria bacterium]|nr:MltA domain-containing protein [Betaproteobacteria bacterium]
MTHIARALFFGLAAIVLMAGCQQLPAPVERQAACPPCAPCAACPPAKPVPAQARYEPAELFALPGWQAAALAQSLKAFAAGCVKIPSSSALKAPCKAAPTVAPDDEGAARRFFDSEFSAYSIVAPDGSSEGLVTGYYEPILAGSLTRTDTYRFPVYGVPDDLIVVDLAALYPDLRTFRLRGRIDGRRLVPYWSRAEIEQRFRAPGESASSGQGAPVLAWVGDPVELFFLQIQGSGQIRLESGEQIRLAYADQNGHPYRSVGRHLIERGELRLEQTSMQGIKAWALANPDRLHEALNFNSSYVFFRVLDSTDGPIGALGVPLTPGYSIAVDPTFVPLGAPVYLAIADPLSARPIERLTMAQDTGGAIRGAVRADFFWGTGDEAGALAGRTRQQGRMWLLWPRGAPLPQ